MTIQRHHVRAGFSILEVLMAIFLGGLLLTAASAFLFGLFNLKVTLEERPAFEEHAEGVVRFLEYAFANAEAPEEEDAEALTFAKIPGSNFNDDEVLSFRLTGELPLFIDPEHYLPELSCYLTWNDEDGLFLLWQSDEMAAEDADDLKQTPLSPYVTQVVYAYYDVDDDLWEEFEEPEEADQGGLKMPDMIKITFTHPEDEREEVFDLLLPAQDADVPLV